MIDQDNSKQRAAARKLFANALATRAKEPVSKQVIPALNVDVAPLSTGQQRLWFLESLEGGRGVYNITMAYEIQGDLNIDQLRQALAQVISCHPVLRVRYALEDGAARQRVQPEAAVTLTDSVLTSDLASELSRVSAEALDLEQGLPCGFHLYERSAHDHVLVMRFHHSVFDGSSMDIVARDLSRAYRGEALESGQVSYLDYATWQQSQMETTAYQSHRDYWLDLLSGELPVLNLPLDHTRPAEQDFTGGMERLQIEGSRLSALRGLARSQQVTLNMLLLSAYYALLWRYTGQSDLVVATSVSSRSVPELDQTVGFFVNTLPLRLQIEPGWRFEQLLGAVRDLSLASMDHQEYSFEQLVTDLKVPRDMSRTPVFQTLFSYREVNSGELDLASTQVRELSIDGRVSRTDMSLWLDASPDALSIALEYATALFQPATVARFLACFDRVLDSITATPQVRIGEIALLSDEECHQVLHDWNDTARDYGSVDLLSLLSRSDDRVAVRSGDRSLSYAGLQSASDRVAAQIQRELGSGSRIVGLALNRSERLLIAMLGIWKAGCAYLPLDPDFPSSRLKFMVSDCDIGLLLTHSDIDQTPFEFAGPTLLLDEMDSWTGERVEQPDLATDLAYIIYTSGSTGKPKGVKVGRSQVVNFLKTMAEQPGLDESDILLAVTTLSFDISVLELCLPLSVGAQVYVVPGTQVADATALGQLLEDTSATVMQATPSTWQLLLASGWAGRPELTVLSGGEPLRLDTASELLSRVGRVWNLYGPTETTVWSTCHEIVASDSRIYIGRPVANTQTYVLDERLNPVPVGVEGELYIGGDGVTQGYHDRPELTSERFPVDVFASEPGRRMYRTGDLVRWDSVGRMEYARRVDQQVKLRGYRIELGEIESALGREVAVDRTAVVVARLGAMDERLVAYVTAAQGESISEIELRKALRRTLPGYMVPQHFVVLDSMPLTANNKIDRKALPKPLEVARKEQVKQLKGPAEEKVAAIWSTALQTQEAIGSDDNFFELGGHSLLSLTVLAEISKAFGVNLSPQSLLMENLGAIAAQCPVDEPEPEMASSTRKPGKIRQWLARRGSQG